MLKAPLARLCVFWDVRCKRRCVLPVTSTGLFRLDWRSAGLVAEWSCGGLQSRVRRLAIPTQASKSFQENGPLIAGRFVFCSAIVAGARDRSGSTGERLPRAGDDSIAPAENFRPRPFPAGTSMRSCCAATIDPAHATPRIRPRPSSMKAGWPQLREAIEQAPAGPLSLYIHVPFCSSPCFYCGCNRRPSPVTAAVAGAYVERVLRRRPA